MISKTAFGVTGKKTLQSFMDIALHLGVKYNDKFCPLSEKDRFSTLYFSHEWNDQPLPNSMSYTTSYIDINIDTIEGMIEALNKLKLFLEEGKLPERTWEQIEAEIGYKFRLI